MGLLVYCALLFLLIMECSTLTCRSEHGPKNEELKKVFNNCINQQQGKSNERRPSSENEWRNRNENQRNSWENDNKSEKREDRNGNRDNRKDRDRNKDYRGNNNDRNDGNNMNENRGMEERHNANGGRDYRMGNTNNMGKGNNGGRNDMTNSYGTTTRLRSQDEFLQSEEYGDTSQNNYYYASIKPPRRYKREKRVEMNSGQRSQYNPHSQRSNGNHDNRDNENGDSRNSSENNSSKEIDKACVLHCFMENLHMSYCVIPLFTYGVVSLQPLADDSGMPDRYLVTHALTKDEKNEDLRDFLQESIEECFQILYNENTEDKCEFSKNLLTCLSEKGRANCDDWNGKPSFLF